MRTYNGFKYLILLVILIQQSLLSQSKDFTSIPLTDLKDFKNPGENWMVTSDFRSDYAEPWKLKKLEDGNGIVINDLSEKNLSHLVMDGEFGECGVGARFYDGQGLQLGSVLSEC